VVCTGEELLWTGGLSNSAQLLRFSYQPTFTVHSKGQCVIEDGMAIPVKSTVGICHRIGT
jgi:hypothetical protein